MAAASAAIACGACRVSAHESSTRPDPPQRRHKAWPWQAAWRSQQALSISVFAAWFSGMRSSRARTSTGSSRSIVRSRGRKISSIVVTRLRAVTPHQVGFTVISATPANPVRSAGAGARTAPPLRRCRSIVPAARSATGSNAARARRDAWGTRLRLFSIGARSRLPDQLSPLGRLDRDKRDDLLAAHVSRLRSKLEQLVVDIGRTHDLLDLSAELRDDRLRGFARREQGVPPQNLEARKFRPRNRGNIRYQLAARETGDGKGAKLARLHLRQHGRDGEEYEIDVAGEHAGHGFGTALVGHMAHVDPRRAFEQLGGEVSGGSVARR